MWKIRLVPQDLRVYVAWESTSQRAFTLGREIKTGEFLLPSSFIGFHFCNLYLFFFFEKEKKKKKQPTLIFTSLKHLYRAELLDCVYFFSLPFQNRF